jgi:hypothetical protein
MRIPSGVTDQYIYFVAVDSTDLKTRETGLSSFTVRRSRNGGASAAYTTPTVNETDLTNMPGVYELLLDEDMTIDSGNHSEEVCLHITQASMAPVTRVFELYRPDVTAGETVTVSSGAVSSVTTVATATAVTTVNGLAANVITAASMNADASAEIADAVWDEDATGHQTQGTFGQAIGDPVADTNTIYKAVVTDATGATVGVDVVAVKAETAIIVVDTTTDIPALIDALPTAAENADAVWDEDATGHQTQGTFGQAIGDPAADANTIFKAVVTDAAGANVAADIIAVKAETAAIVADTNELQTDWVDGGRLDLIVDAILDDTDDIGVAGAGLTAINLPDQTMNITGDITGSLSGSVGSVTGAVGSVTGNVGGTINGLTATAIKDFFDTDSTTTYASAVAGSVVKEIADNAGGGTPPSAAEIADAVWDEDATGHQTQGTFGQAIGDPAADTNTIFKAVVTDAAGANVAADIIAVKAETASILDDTDDIGVAGAGLTAINLPDQTMNITGDITGNISGSVGSVTGAVGSVTGAVGSVTGNVGGTINGLTATALKDFFDTDSATTYASAVAGSVVKEIADNAGGASLTVQDIVDGVWDEDASGHQTQGTFGQTVGDSVADASSIHAYAAASYVHLDTVVVPTVNAIVADTAEIGAAGAGLTNINLPNQTMDIVGNITGNLSGSVGSVTGAVGSVTGAVGSVAAGGITASSFAANAITAAKLDPDVTTELQAGLATAANLATVAGYLDTEIAAILADTNELQTDWVNGGRLDLILDARASQASVDDLPTNAELATSQAAADDATLAAIAALNNLSAAQVNAEVVDALATDTYAEPGQGNPAATTSLSAKLGYLYKAWRNKTEQTASEYALYADDGTTKDQEAVVSDDGSTFTRGEVSTGA